jgi:dihydrofolate reductase
MKMIVAVSPTGVIGVLGQIPWKKSADLKRFKAVTMGGTLIMGRKTFDSMGRRQLPGRHTIILSRAVHEGVASAQSLEGALEQAAEKGKPVWVVGGSEVYELALPLVSEIDLTLVGDYSLPDPLPVTLEVTYFQPYRIGLEAYGFTLHSNEPNPEDDTLYHRRYVRQ